MIALKEARDLYDMMKGLADRGTARTAFDYRASRWPAKSQKYPVSLDWVVNGGKTQGVGNALMPRECKKSDIDQDEMLVASLHFACHVINKYRDVGGIFLPDLDDSIRAVNTHLVFWNKRGGSGDYPMHGYDVSEHPDTHATVMSLLWTDGRAAKEITKRLATNVLFGVQMPDWATRAVYQILVGDLVPPPAPDREATERQRDTLLAALAEGIQERTFYKGSANQSRFAQGEPVPVCACTIAAAALTAFGVPVNPRNASNIYRDRKDLPLNRVNLRMLLSVPMQSGATILSSEPPDVKDKVFKALEYLCIPAQR